MADQEQKNTIQSWTDREVFVSFADTPFENDLSSLLEREDTQWCLLGEIIDAATLFRPRLVCRDVRGRDFVVAFYPDGGAAEPGMRRILKNFKVGNTVAIFYAVGHLFLDQTLGVRVEETDKVLVMPIPLKDALSMNKQTSEFVKRDAMPLKCHGCDEVRDNLDKCGRCALFHYCNRECQMKGWDSHKQYCKVLKDENVKKLLLLDYDIVGHNQISFR